MAEEAVDYGNDDQLQYQLMGMKSGKRKRKESFNTYIFNIVKSMYPTMGISKKGMDVLNSFIFDIFHRICKETKNLMRFTYKSCLGAKDIHTAIKLLFPMEMSEIMNAELARSINAFDSKQGLGRESKQSKCGLTLPIGRIQRYIKHYGYARRVENTAGIGLTAALECVLMELLKETRDVTNEQNQERITPRTLLLAMKKDKDFSTMTELVCVPDGGVLPDVSR